MATNEFDVMRAADISALFYSATGLPCMVVDEQGRVISEAGDSREPYMLCSEAGRLAGEQAASACAHQTAAVCAAFHLYMGYQSRRFGGQYIDFCPLAQTHFGTPILKNHRMVGAILAGPVTLIDPDDLTTNDFRLPHASPADIAEAKQLFCRVTKISPERAHVCSELLFELASKLSDDSYLAMVKSAHDQRMRHHLFNLLTEGDKQRDSEPYSSRQLQEWYKAEKMLTEAIIGKHTDAITRSVHDVQAQLMLLCEHDVLRLKRHLLEHLVVLSRAFFEAGAGLHQALTLTRHYEDRLRHAGERETLFYLHQEYVRQLSHMPAESAAPGHHSTGRLTLAYMNEHYAEDLQLPEVARHCNVSPSHFSRLLKAETGRSFRDNLNLVRILAAKKLLAEPHLKIADIAIAVGFRDQSYFTRVFKKTEGMTPSRYRAYR